MISGLEIIPLKNFSDDRGTIFQMLRTSDPHFNKFGEVYFSQIKKGVIKGWHTHLDLTLNIACVIGSLKTVIYDNREGSSTFGKIQEIIIGPDNYNLIIIPNGLTHGFQAMTENTIFANVPDIPHNELKQGELIRTSIEDSAIPYNW